MLSSSSLTFDFNWIWKTDCAGLFVIWFPIASAILLCKTWKHDAVFVHQEKWTATTTELNIVEKRILKNHSLKCIFLQSLLYRCRTLLFVFMCTIWPLAYIHFKPFCLFSLRSFQSDSSVSHYVLNKPYNALAHIVGGRTAKQQFLFAVHAVWLHNNKNINDL